MSPPLRRAVLLSLAVLGSWASACSDPSTCSTDAECFEGQICSDGKCVSSSGGDARTSDVDEEGDSTDADASGTDADDPGADSRPQPDAPNGGEDTDDDPDTGGPTYVDVAAGRRHGCGLLSDGRVYCWGDSGGAQQDVPTDERFVAIRAGSEVTCGVTRDDKLVCWGWQDVQSETPKRLPSNLKSGTSFDVGTGGSSYNYAVVCVQEQQGSTKAFCYARKKGNDFEVVGADSLRDLSVGDQFACAATERGIICNGKGEFPPGSATERDAIGSAKAISCGPENCCAVESTNDVTCFYEHSRNFMNAPMGAMDLVAAGEKFACGRRVSNGTVRCWGHSSREAATIPMALAKLNVADLDAGNRHACLLTRGGKIECWGKSDDQRTAAPSPSIAVSRLESGK
ncbi:MAG: RCC1 domain-containing protein [Bradymonadaceae bacterium]